MKSYLLIAVFCLLANTAAANTIENTLDDYFAAWNQHNTKRIEAFFAPEVVWYDLAADKTVEGKDKVFPAITGYFMGSVADMYWYRSGDVYISENTIIYEWTYGGTFNGHWGEDHIADKPFSLKGISTTTFNEQGKITAQKDYYDMDSFKRALGVKS